MNAPAYRLNDAPVAPHRFLERYLVNANDSLEAVDLRIEASKFDPCLSLVFQRSGNAVGVITTHIADLLGCGGKDVLPRMRKYLSNRFGLLEVQKDDFARIGMEALQGKDGSVEITQETSTDLLDPTATSPSLRRDRNRALTDEELQTCRSKLGELCWLATVSRPDICARLARFSANLNSLEVVGIYRINDLIKTVKKRQQECTLKYSAGLPTPAPRFLSCPDAGWGQTRPIHEDTMLLTGWSDAALGTHERDGRCRLEHLIALMSSTLTGPVRIPQWASRFTRKRVKSSLGGKIFAVSEMWGHMDMIREFYTALGRKKLAPYELIGCESPLSHLRTGRLGAEKSLTRHFRSILGALASGDLGNIAWGPGTDNPADGVTKATSDHGPLLQMLESGTYRPGRSEQLKGVSFLEKA